MHGPSFFSFHNMFLCFFPISLWWFLLQLVDLVFFTRNISLIENVSFAADLVNTFEDTHMENTPFKRQA